MWACRYRLHGRGSQRIQVGGFATRFDAQRALDKALDRLRAGGRAAALTLVEFVEEYLQAHPGLPVTVSKLRWLLSKATAALGDVRLIDLTPEQVCKWRMTIPEGHRYEATQALRQVLNRAVAWELLDYDPAKRGVPNPLRRSLEKRPFESWGALMPAHAMISLRPLLQEALRTHAWQRVSWRGYGVARSLKSERRCDGDRRRRRLQR